VARAPIIRISVSPHGGGSFVQKVIKAAAGIGWQAASHGN